MGAVYELHPHAALAKAVGRICGEAEDRLNAARGLSRQVPASARPALLSAVVAADTLRRLRRVRHDVFHHKVQRRPAMLAARLAWTAWRKTY